MDESKHKSHIEVIEEMLNIYSKLDDFLNNPEGMGYEDWTNYIGWIHNQKTLLQECLKKLRENYSYASIFPVIREIYENFWFVHLAMNGIKHYKYFKVKKGQSPKRVYNKWLRDLETAHRKGDLKDILNVNHSEKSKIIKVSYRGERIKINGKLSKEFIPIYHFLIDDYNPIEAYIGKQKKIIEKYLTPPHLFNRFVQPNKDLNRYYFDFQEGIIPHLLLNNLITKKQKQRIIIHYNFLSLWAHPNKIAFIEAKNNFDFRNSKVDNPYMDRLVLLYIGHLTKMFLESFLKFLKRQEQEDKISSPDEDKLKEITEKIKNFENTTNYFWFIHNKPSKFYKFNYAIHKIWRKGMFQRNIKKINLSEIKDIDIPYYRDPLNLLKEISRGWTNALLGEYKPELKWE
ncbi:MAG: hypothetical protein ABIH65_03860 [Nanoarchaeota archaeon]